MGLEIYMVGLLTRDMGKSLDFYRQLGMELPALPTDDAQQAHIEVKMNGGLTFFLDTRGTQLIGDGSKGTSQYPFLLEFYLENAAAVDAKYQEMVDAGYVSQRAPYNTNFGMRFAFIKDPDGNLVLLSGALQ